MLNSPKHTKPLSFFKPNRSQSSLRGSNAGDSKRQSSYLESPADSAINSPQSSHHPLDESAASSEFFGSARSDDSPTSQAAESGFHHYQDPSTTTSHRGLQRSQSSRSPTSRFTGSSSTVGSFVPRASQSPQPSGGLNESANNSWLHDQGASPEPKKKRGFLRGFSDLRRSKDPSAAAAQKASRRVLLKNPRAPPPHVVAQHLRQTQQSPYPSILSSTREEDSDEEIVTKNLYRHSVAIPTAAAASYADPSSPEDFYSSASTTANRETFAAAAVSPLAPPKTASGQQPLPSEQGGGHESGAWERMTRLGHQRNPSSSSTQHQYPPQPQNYHLAAQSGAAGLTSLHRSRLDPSYSEQSNSRPSSRQSLEPPSPSHLLGGGQTVRRRSSGQGSSLAEKPLPSAGGPSHTGRGNMDGSQQGAQTASNRGQYGSNLSVNSQQTSNYPPTSPGASSMQGDNSSSGERKGTPPPAKTRDDLSNLDVPALIGRFEELNEKYRKVKKYYFDKDAQVQQLQNTLAVQRLAQSRTSLDDNEYATRFSRLDGAINNLAFNIRKDWRAVPPWLATCVNKDATTTVTKEMTAVGRACISRWLVDELFDRYFHPALEPALSGYLKIIEKNLRRFAPPTPTEEDREALLAKISNWRLATLDGLQDMLNSHDATENRAALTKMLVEMLTQDLTINLKDQSPQGLQAGVVGIIELAVGVAASIPLESRDVYVDYIMPGTPVNEAFMKVEGPLPALTNPGEGHPAPGAGPMEGGIEAEPGSAEEKEEDESAGGAGKEPGKEPGKKKGMFTGLMSGGKKIAQAGRGAAEHQPPPPKEDRVRFAAFMSVEVRAKAMLVKAPVYV